LAKIFVTAVSLTALPDEPAAASDEGSIWD
jgi:hypothetical protein